MLINLIILFLFIIFFSLNIFADAKRRAELGTVTKPLLVPSIILFYALNTENMDKLLIMALFFGFIGDVVLLGREKLFIYWGMAAFLTGHIFYTVTFVNSIDNFHVINPWFYLMIMPYLIYGSFMIGYLWKNIKVSSGGKLLISTMIIYMCALFAMSFTSLCRLWTAFNAGTLLPFIGSLFFISSDSYLACQIVKEKLNYVQTYYKKSNIDTMEVIIMVTYVVAQSLIMLGFLFQ
ncbi:lysoplasmalogenase [Pseudobacteroides cellulosolvens]|uniref:YhhN family protein n=1 Tax=Pseudobacteroides cellulosolvens ATCC 35603 = DSM 2933 TaxID=398512 RepID=A0A0L6JRD2_9FIRM|nr:lysoplasmalogenase [Pseudobacteroides cellulosolvens]KNY27952.1 YhhN family protein [Pseudobacteroides cellulosolvens ATCC 35603 = DSM 2933]